MPDLRMCGGEQLRGIFIPQGDEEEETALAGETQEQESSPLCLSAAQLLPAQSGE